MIAVPPPDGRDPSQATIVEIPGYLLIPIAHEYRADGFGTSANPWDTISNTPSSWVAPKRFLTDRSKPMTGKPIAFEVQHRID